MQINRAFARDPQSNKTTAHFILSEGNLQRLFSTNPAKKVLVLKSQLPIFLIVRSQHAQMIGIVQTGRVIEPIENNHT